MRITRILLSPVLPAAAALLAAGLAACGSGAGHDAGGSAGAGRSPDTQTAAIVHCYRTHGDPSFPDPVYDPGDGEWHFAISPGTAPAATQQACRHLFPSASASPPVPQAQFGQLVRLAACIRQHGVPDWPDPRPDGAFQMGPPYQKTPAAARALQACRRYVPSGGIDVVAVP